MEETRQNDDGSRHVDDDLGNSDMVLVCTENAEAGAQPKGAPDPSIRRSAIPRTPPGGRLYDRTESTPQEILKDEAGEDRNINIRQSHKRPRINTPEKQEERESRELPGNIGIRREDWEKLKLNYMVAEKTIRQLQVLVKNSVSTKVEIKKTVIALSHDTDRMTKALKICEERRAKEQDKPARNDPQISTSCQTSPQGKGKGGPKKLGACDIDNISNYDDLLKVTNPEWPKNLFTTTYMVVGNPLYANRDADKVFWEENLKERDPNVAIKKAYEVRFPELKGQEGKITQLRVSIKVLSSTDENLGRDQVITRIRLEEDKRDWFEALSKLKTLSASQDRKKIAFYPPKGDSKGEDTRKMLECIFRGSGIKCLVYIKQGNSKEKKQAGSGQAEMKKLDKKMETIILKPVQGLDFAQVVKHMKDRVEVKDFKVGGIERTHDGNVKIWLKGKGVDARAGIAEKLQDVAEVRKNVRTKTVMLLDIDETVEELDIKTAILKGREERPDDHLTIKLASNVNKRGCKHAFISMSEALAGELAKLKRLGEGWHIGGLSLITPGRCFLCKRVGHEARECPLKGQGESCHNCGKTGHKVKECKMESFCYLCNAPGHKAEIPPNKSWQRQGRIRPDARHCGQT